jgi:hypothetical protein
MQQARGHENKLSVKRDRFFLLRVIHSLTDPVTPICSFPRRRDWASDPDTYREGPTEYYYSYYYYSSTLYSIRKREIS